MIFPYRIFPFKTLPPKHFSKVYFTGLTKGIFSVFHWVFSQKTFRKKPQFRRTVYKKELSHRECFLTAFSQSIFPKKTFPIVLFSQSIFPLSNFPLSIFHRYATNNFPVFLQTKFHVKLEERSKTRSALCHSIYTWSRVD